MPLTNPRRATNHRVVTVATSAIDIEPVPRPTRTPHSRISCQLCVMKTVSPLPAATNPSAAVTTGRMPKRSIRAAANGEVSPNSAMLTDIAAPIVPCDQPNWSCSGSSSTPGTERNPAAPSIVTKVTAATVQAGWMRRRDRVGRTVDVLTRRSSRPPARPTSGRTADMCKDSAMTSTPHRVAVLLLPPVIGFDATIPVQLLGSAEDGRGRRLYDVQMVSLTGEAVPTSSGYAIVPTGDATTLARADTVIVPGTRLPGPRYDGVLPPDLAAAFAGLRPGVRLVSICTGAFVLAAAGVLDG